MPARRVQLSSRRPPFMRVLHITNAGGYGRVQLGGAERAVADLTAYFATALGWQVGVVAPQEFLNHGTLSDAVEMFPEPFDKGALPRLTRIVRRFRPVIGVTHLLRATLIGQPALAACGVPARISNLHNSLVQIQDSAVGTRRTRWHRYAFGGVTLLCSHATVAISSSNCVDLVERQRIPRSRTRLIENWVDDSFFEADAVVRGRELRASLGLGRAQHVLGFVGRLETQKNAHFAVRLLPSLPDAHLVIVGIGAELESIRTLAVSLGVDGRVHFPGYQADMPPWYAAFDVLLVPSVFEGFGRVAVEALAVGTPVIGNDVPGLAGVLDEIGPPAAWKRPLEPSSEWAHLARTVSLAPTAREATRDLVAKRFGIAQAFDRYRQMYAGILSARRAP
jgi:glycosyltransferase involved in cell wall biosynthesis